jgi:alkylated DNA repair dioxygenase AlkB
MAQLTLFGSHEIVVTDGERGRIVYTPAFVDAATAARWFDELRHTVPWRSEKRMMYDREVEVPRLLGSYRFDPVSTPFDAADGAASADRTVPAAILEARSRVTDYLDVPFNAVGLNLYRDGRDSVAPHNDHLNEIQAGFPIALVSLGATRRMTIREKEAPRTTTHIDLEAGSLFVMDYDTQLHYTHGVPKTSDPVGERISLAFRVKRPRRGSSGAADTGVYK